MNHSTHEHALEILFHPPLVHFPIAFLLLEAFLICLWLKKENGQYEAFAYLTLKLALILIPVVMLAGYIDAGGIVERVRWHFFSALTLFVITGMRFCLRWRQGPTLWRSSRKPLALALLLASVLLTLLTGYLGSLMVYG